MSDVPSEYEGDQGEATFDDEDMAFIRSLLKDDRAIPTALFVVVQWMDPDTGKWLWRKYCPADTPVSQVAGLVQMAVLQMFSESGLGIGLVEDDG